MNSFQHWIQTAKHTKILLLCLIAYIATTTELTADSNLDIDRSLDRINVKHFLNSESYSVNLDTIALGKSDIQLLVKNCEHAIPKMIGRINNQNGIDKDNTLIAYFVVFRHCNDPSVLPVLANYLDLDASDSMYLLFCHAAWVFTSDDCGLFYDQPLLYALRAVNAFVELPDFQTRDLFHLRHKIADLAREEYKRRTGLIANSPVIREPFLLGIVTVIMGGLTLIWFWQRGRKNLMRN